MWKWICLTLVAVHYDVTAAVVLVVTCKVCICHKYNSFVIRLMAAVTDERWTVDIDCNVTKLFAGSVSICSGDLGFVT